MGKQNEVHLKKKVSSVTQTTLYNVQLKALDTVVGLQGRPRLGLLYYHVGLFTELPK